VGLVRTLDPRAAIRAVTPRESASKYQPHTNQSRASALDAAVSTQCRTLRDHANREKRSNSPQKEQVIKHHH
jgi:hypothetical protein